ncbi:S-layer homology domain-containing protein [Paenibacillus pini]|uniref:Subtilisin-like serine proteases n=1 Tax=Paenibacillus pini JCM 16418 TaxID=1236976 RepID=W7YSM8_9BACL|nr:S-layer homology domain-containing protein [Paenibacillus pini]GAF07641.1 subtilisin-like serine proteases [Paenibacillus pini JCM 16418]
MRIKQTLTAMAAVCLLSVSLGSTIFANGSEFKDISSSVAKDQIMSLKDRNLVKGVTATEFQPQAKLSNAQGVQLIASGLQLSLAAIDFNKAPRASDLFSNVNDKAWFAEAFINAHYNGVDIPKDMDPSKSMTKEEFTYYLMGGLEKVGNLPMVKIAPTPITDNGDMNSMYEGSIQRSLLWKINSLDGAQNFNPKRNITREEAAIMLYNALEYLKAHLQS